MSSSTAAIKAARSKTATAATRKRRQRDDVAFINMEVSKDLKERVTALKRQQGGTWAEFLEMVVNGSLVSSKYNESSKINFCPMCGRDLQEPKP